MINIQYEPSGVIFLLLEIIVVVVVVNISITGSKWSPEVLNCYKI